MTRAPALSSRMAATTMSVTPPFWRTGPTQSRVSRSASSSGATGSSFGNVDEDVVTDDRHVEARENRRFGVDASSRAGVVLPAVRRARENEPFEVPLAEPDALV